MGDAEQGAGERGGVAGLGVALTEISARKIYVKFIKRNKRRQQKQVAAASIGRALLGATHTHTEAHTHPHTQSFRQSLA